MFPAWFTTMASGGAGAFIAALSGALLGFRRTRNERALDRRIGWHSEAIEALALYEERLERLNGHALHVLVIERKRTTATHPPSESGNAPDLPKTVRAPEILWKDLGDAERRARAALRLADLYTDGRTQLECSVALSNSINLVSKQWIDISAEPEIPWIELQAKAFAAASVRRRIQESLKAVLELEGFLANILGPRYRKRRALKRIKRLQAELAAEAAASQEFLAQATARPDTPKSS